MKGELKKIKKKFGEEMAHFCRDNLSSLLETEDLLYNLLIKHFGPNDRLFEDLSYNDLLDDFGEYICGLLKPPKDIVTTDKDPFILMSEAGYDLYECHDEREIKNFKHFYAPGEELCTFNGHRLDKCFVFFAVKKNAEQLDRKHFISPDRQDEYGTSVISIQFKKTKTNMVSIKNRYNHSVSNPDATFSNNLDNIIPGLTYSFQNYYGFNIKVQSHDFEIPGYVLTVDDQFYHFNYAVDGRYYCMNNTIIEDFEVKKYDPSKYLLMDSYLLDLEKKEIDLEKSTIGLANAIGKIHKIEVNKKVDGKIVRISNDLGDIIITLDLDNMIIDYCDDNIKILPNNFMMYNESLEKISCENVIGIGNNVLKHNIMLQELYLPNCLTIGSDFLKQNLLLEQASLPSLRKAGSNFLKNNVYLSEGYMPLLRSVGPGFLHSYANMNKVYAPNLDKSQILPSEDTFDLTLVKKL